jgi:hypothetical protein
VKTRQLPAGPEPTERADRRGRGRHDSAFESLAEYVGTTADSWPKRNAASSRCSPPTIRTSDDRVVSGARKGKHMRPSELDWEERLALATQIDEKRVDVQHSLDAYDDQLTAATQHAQRIATGIGSAVNAMFGGTTPQERQESTTSRRMKIAAYLGCGASCHHVRNDTAGPQPLLVNLALRRVDCERCSRTIRKPPPDETDRCDWCGSRGHTTFTPTLITSSALVFMGDACETCARALGVYEEDGDE